jgi:hypothetical protein
MDGRIQEPVIRYLKKKHGAEHVDVITEPGPCGILAGAQGGQSVDSILERTDISLHKHGSRLIAVSGHYDCAGNPVEEAIQKEQIRASIEFLKVRYPEAEVLGLWIDDEWKVSGVR